MPSEQATYRQGIKAQLDRIEQKVEFTNGKVKKITLALVLAFGLILGIGFDKFGPVLAILLAA